MGKNGVNPKDAEGAGAEDDKNSGNKGFSKSASRSNGIVHKGGNTVAERHDGNAPDSGIDHGSIIGEDREEGIAQQIQSAAQKQSGKKGIEQTDQIGFHNPIFFLRTVVLRKEACTGGVKGCHHVINQWIGIGSSGITLHHYMIEGVDAGLHKQVGNGKDGVLQGGGQTDFENAHQLVRDDAKLLKRQGKIGVAFQQNPENQHCGQVLGEDAGKRYSQYIQMKQDDEQQVEQHIQNTGEQQVVQGAFGVPRSTQHSIAEVVQAEGRHAKQVNAQIEQCVLQQLFLGMDGGQDAPGEQNAEEGNQDARRKAQQQRGVNGFPQIFFASGADIECSQGIDTAGKTDQKSGKKCDERAGGAHGTEGNGTGKFADYGYVGHIEQNLKDVGKHQRNAVHKYFFPERACAEIHFISLFHRYFFLLSRVI